VAQLTPVLYGTRLYSQTLYSENYDRETFNVVLSDSVGPLDALNSQLDKILADLVPLIDSVILKEADKVFVDSITLSDIIASSLEKTLSDAISNADSLVSDVNKPLLDYVSFTDALVTNLTKALTDSIGLSEVAALNVTRSLSDVFSSTDSVIVVIVTKTLQDILLLQDWVSLRLSKPNIWTVTVPQLVFSSLYGRALYGRSVYSSQGRIIPWLTVKPAATNGGWKSFNELEPHS